MVAGGKATSRVVWSPLPPSVCPIYPTMTLSDVEEQLAVMIQANVMKKVTPDTLLLESGLLDSVAVVDLMLAIEGRFGCTVPITQVEEHLHSLRSLATYVAASA